jgi:hypothetical protein
MIDFYFRYVRILEPRNSVDRNNLEILPLCFDLVKVVIARIPV